MISHYVAYPCSCSTWFIGFKQLEPEPIIATLRYLIPWDANWVKSCHTVECTRDRIRRRWPGSTFVVEVAISSRPLLRSLTLMERVKGHGKSRRMADTLCMYKIIRYKSPLSTSMRFFVSMEYYVETMLHFWISCKLYLISGFRCMKTIITDDPLDKLSRWWFQILFYFHPYLCNFQNTCWFKPFMGDNYVKKWSKLCVAMGPLQKRYPPFWMFMFTLQKHAGVG